jgi:hypothetical protein
MLEHLAADDEIVGIGRLERRVGHLSDRDPLAHFGSSQLHAALGKVDRLDVDADFPEQVMSAPGPQPRSSTLFG